MRRRGSDRIVGLGLTLLGVALSPACSGNVQVEARGRAADCHRLCNEWRALPCYAVLLDPLNPLINALRTPVACEEECERALSPASCQDAWDRFVRCAADRGLQCAGAPSSIRLEDCDAEAFQFMDACGTCAAAPSGDAQGCAPNAGEYYRCSSSDAVVPGMAAPMCFPACTEVTPNAFCCQKDYLETPCDPKAGPGCAPCQP